MPFALPAFLAHARRGSLGVLISCLLVGLTACYDDGPTYVEAPAALPAPLPAPTGLDAVALDGAVWLTWSDVLRSRSGFSHYQVFIQDGAGTVRWVGDTDVPGFLDLLVENGVTVSYALRAVDQWGQVSATGPWVLATPRPDFHGEWIFAWEDVPSKSGFRFPDDDQADPIRHGSDPQRDFRMEVDAEGWWIVPGPGVQIHQTPVATTALRCGPAADPGCTDIPRAPSSGYGTDDLELIPGFSYVLRMPDGQGRWYHGVIRITHLGFAREGALALFDWAFQRQPGNPSLLPPSIHPDPALAYPPWSRSWRQSPI
jgi:hypothetical protein